MRALIGRNTHEISFLPIDVATVRMRVEENLNGKFIYGPCGYCGRSVDRLFDCLYNQNRGFHSSCAQPVGCSDWCLGENALAGTTTYAAGYRGYADVQDSMMKRPAAGPRCVNNARPPYGKVPR